ncbi:MAG: hypothetical protein D6719_00470 [Candidatus Dadabacteria bacterium]|nr:MAG: hypothetical protein D6719_00470 [Candidatus Dadabacteria bacterium]
MPRLSFYIFLALSFANLFTARCWVHELLVNLSPLFLIIHIVTLPVVIQLSRKNFLRGGICGLLSCIMIYSYSKPLGNYFLSGEASLQTGAKISIAVIEGFSTNADVADVVKNKSADLFIIASGGPYKISAARFGRKFSFKRELEILDRHYLVLSNLEVSNAGYKFLVDGGPPIYSAQFAKEKAGEFKLYVAGANIPFDQDSFFLKKLLTRRLATMLRHSEFPLVLVADLKATPYSRFYRIIQDGGRLNDLYFGSGSKEFTGALKQLFKLSALRVLYGRGLAAVNKRFDSLGERSIKYLEFETKIPGE